MKKTIRSTKPQTKIALVGEAWGEKEAELKSPFVGPAGLELYRMLYDAGFPLEPITKRFIAPRTLKALWDASGIPLLNVFNRRPKDNNVEEFFGTAHDDIAPDVPAYRGKHLLRQHLPDYETLHAEPKRLRPNIITALNNTAMWALLGLSKISAERGSIHNSPFGKIIPTYHPAAILRNWSDRPIVVADLIKARSESTSHEFHQTARTIWHSPTLSDLAWFFYFHIRKAPLLSIDIETERNAQISEIGIATSATTALHIPFLVGTKRGTKFLSCHSYWPTLQDEFRAWSFIRLVMNLPTPKLFQNGQYDIYWLWRSKHIRVRNYAEDTMLLHHALYPELQKGLGFLGATYTNEPTWKHLRHESNKADE